MSRTVMMTIGFLLIFAGIQLHLVESYVLTPRITAFLSDKFSNQQAIANPLYATNAQQANGFPANPPNSPYRQAGYQNPINVAANTAPLIGRNIVGASGVQSRVISPPHWVCWPVIFLGAVILLNGAIRR